MRTWSVSGTAFALCTRASSLSIRTSTSMVLRVYRRLSAEQPAKPSLPLGLRVGLGLQGRGARGLVLARLVAAEHPAAPARAQLLEQLGGVAGDELDLVRLRQLGLDAVGGVALAAPRAELLQHVLGLPAREPDMVAAREQRLELAEIAHSCGFSGVPGRPFGNSSLNRRATGSGTSSSTLPPKLAISLTPLEETKLTCGLAIT